MQRHAAFVDPGHGQGRVGTGTIVSRTAMLIVAGQSRRIAGPFRGWVDGGGMEAKAHACNERCPGAARPPGQGPTYTRHRTFALAPPPLRPYVDQAILSLSTSVSLRLQSLDRI
jgi:hypothetical protein